MTKDEWKKKFGKERTAKKREEQQRKAKLREEAPTNAVAGGAIAGAGVGPQGEPGKKKKSSAVIADMLRRKMQKPC